MKKGFLGFGTAFDLFGLDMPFVNYGGYADPAQSIALSPPNPSPSPFSYYFPVVEQRHHYDVSYYNSDSYANGPFAWGNFSFSNLSIDTVDYYSIFGHTQLWHVSSNSGYGSWFSAPDYNASNGHYWSSESAGIHTDSWLGSSDSFVFRNTESVYSHLGIGNLSIDQSQLVIHEGAGHHEDSIFARLDSFAFRDTVVSQTHVQNGDYFFDALHTDVRSGSQTVYADAFGGYLNGHESSVAIHDQWSQQGNGRFEQHIAEYSSHTVDVVGINMPAYMASASMIDDMSLMLGMGGGKG